MPLPGGEHAGRAQMHAWLRDGIDGYADAPRPRSPAAPRCSSPYLHFGCVSAARARGARRPPRRLHAPARLARLLRPRAPAPPRQRQATRTAASSTASSGTARTSTSTPGARAAPAIPWSTPACASSRTTGWMHNRARLITACFLVKDLHIDWRRGEQHFMRLLLDGDQANNNGNWQWISSVGVDPAPLHRRLYNPVLQQQRHDPDGEYVRRWVPGARGHPAREARDAVGGGRAGADRRPRGRAPAHAGGLRRRARLVSSARDRRTSRSSPADRSRSPPRRASSPAGRPGRARSTTTRCGCDFLVDDWSGPAHVVLREADERRPRHRRGRQRRARDRPGGADRLARPRRHRLPGGRRARPDRRRAAARQRLPAPGALPLALRGGGLVGDLRPHPATRRPTKLRDALSSDGIFPAPEQLLAAARARRPAGEQGPAPARDRTGRARGQARPRAAARGGPQRRLHAAAGAAGHRPVLRRA